MTREEALKRADGIAEFLRLLAEHVKDGEAAQNARALRAVLAMARAFGPMLEALEAGHEHIRAMLAGRPPRTTTPEAAEKMSAALALARKETT